MGAGSPGGGPGPGSLGSPAVRRCLAHTEGFDPFGVFFPRANSPPANKESFTGGGGGGGGGCGCAMSQVPGFL